jgi:hypothetical protein
VKNHTDRNWHFFPYFFNMQKIFCLKWDGHAWYRNIIFMGCTIADICANCKCNRFCLKGKKGENNQKRYDSVFPFFPSNTKMH